MSADAKDDRIRSLEAEIARLHTMLSSAPDFITRITVDGDFLYLNRLAPGFRMEDVIGTSSELYVPPEYRDRAREAMRRASETRSTQEYATIGQTSTNRMGHYLTRVSPVIEHDEVTSLVMIATDVTALEESRTLLQVALNATGLGIWTFDPGEQRGTWDAATRKIFGAPEGTTAPPMAELLRDYLHPDDRQLVAESLEQAQRTGRYGPTQYRLVARDGSVKWVSASGIALRDGKGEMLRLVGSVQDITEQRAMEARLLEAQKLESIGRLAGGIAHDFNNLLTIIIGNVDQVDEARSLEEVRAHIGEVRSAAQRSAKLTAQLLAFARRQVIELKVVDPNRVVTGLDALLRRVLGDQIQLNWSLDARGRIRVDPGQLDQVIMNLVANARDAMPEGGTLRVSTADVEIQEGDRRHPAEVGAGAYVVLSVADTGHGIAAEALPHVFEPFYTTRATGTGLGLATCHGIAKQCGGHLTVQSRIGQGSTFSLYFPLVAEEPADMAAARDNAPLTPARPERILVVEDEPAVCAVIRRILERRRYEVSTAGTAEEALRVVEASAPFDALITDLSMPGMGGRELALRLTERFPELKVLYVSGYPENSIARGGVVEPGLELLQKPFVAADLLARLREVLHGRGGNSGPGR